MKFKNIRNKTSISQLESLGFYHDDFVIVLFDDGEVLCGKLSYIKEYSKLFDVVLILDRVYWGTKDMISAIGMVKVEFEA